MVNKFFLGIARYGVQKIRNFMLISKWGLLSLHLMSYKKNFKNRFFRDFLKKSSFLAIPFDRS
jgi:hypothetical protein